MMPYRVIMHNLVTGNTEESEETYQTESEAENARDNWASEMSAGAEMAEDLGDGCTDPDDLEFEIVEE